MSKKKKNEPEKPLTEVELELMGVIWSLGPCTVKDVHLGVSRELAYTSVATMMKILEQKGFLRSQKGERAHTYEALLSREQYGGASLKLLAERVFEGNPSSMVMRLLDDSKLSTEELTAIRRLLDTRLKEGK